LMMIFQKTSDSCKDFSFALSNNARNKIDLKDVKMNWDPTYVEHFIFKK